MRNQGITTRSRPCEKAPVIQDILKQQTTLSAQYTDALSQYGPKFPKVLRLQAQLKDLDQLITREKLNIGNQMEADYRGSRQRELLLKQALDEQKAEVNQMAEKIVQYNILKREADTNKQLYDGMLQKLKEAGITAGLRSSNIRIVDPALIPGGPSRPNKSRNILLSILVGLLGGIGLALLREYLDNTVKTPDDIETLARLPSLAVVPALIQLQRKAPRPFFETVEDRRRDLEGRPRGTDFAQHAAVANVGGISRAAHVFASVAGGPSAPGHLDDQRAAARRQDHGGGQSGRDSRAAWRQDACWWTPICASPASTAR